MSVAQLLEKENKNLKEKKKRYSLLLIPSICSGDIADLKMVQSNLLRAFWHISQEPDLSQIRDL